MFLKFATTEILDAQMGQVTGFAKSAHRAVFNYKPRDGYLYVRSRAISSRCNDNFDMFPAEEIEKSYLSFIGKPVFVNHHNENHYRARGVIIDAALHRDRNPDGSPDTWVELLHEVDAVSFPKLAKAIVAKEVNRTSMGCDVQFSKCSVCHNVATTPHEYCDHIPGKKGKKIARFVEGKRDVQLVFEICSGLSFFENSLLVEQPADPTAFFLGDVEYGPGTEHMAKVAAKTADPMQPWRDNHRPIDFSAPKEQTWQKTATRTNNSNSVWTLLAQAAAEGTPVTASAKRSVHDLIREAIATGDDLYEEDFRHTALERKPDTPTNNPERHDYLEHHAGDGKGVRNLLDLVHQSAQHEGDLHSGMKWYDDAHGVAKTMAEHHRGQEGHVFHGLSSEDALHRTAGTIGVYSSSSAPAPNMHMAMDALHHGQAIYSKPVKNEQGKVIHNTGFNPQGEGHEHDRKGLPMADDLAANKINGMLHHGKSIDESWGGKAHKTHNFSHLIADPNSVDNKGRDRVVVDRHAIAAVLGHKGSSGEVYDNPNGPKMSSLLTSKKGYDKVADMYRDAAHHINSSDEFKPLREKLQTSGLLKPGERVRAHHVQALTWVQQKKISGSKTTTKDQNQIDAFQGAYHHRYGDAGHKPVNWQGFVGGDDRHDKTSRLRYLAYGETKAPQDVNTLRAENCTVCGNSTAFDGVQCQVCGYTAPPRPFGDPDTESATINDLRKNVLDSDDNMADPNDPDQQLGNQVGDPEEVENQEEEAALGGTQGGMLTCTNCGTGLQPSPPQTSGGEPPYPAEGDACPVCKQGELLSEQDPGEDADGDGIPDEEEEVPGPNDPAEEDAEEVEEEEEDPEEDEDPKNKKRDRK